MPKIRKPTRVAGLEPANTGAKILCLTIWRYPKTLFPHQNHTRYIAEQHERKAADRELVFFEIQTAHKEENAQAQ